MSREGAFVVILLGRSKVCFDCLLGGFWRSFFVTIYTCVHLTHTSAALQALMDGPSSVCLFLLRGATRNAISRRLREER